MLVLYSYVKMKAKQEFLLIYVELGKYIQTSKEADCDSLVFGILCTVQTTRLPSA